MKSTLEKPEQPPQPYKLTIVLGGTSLAMSVGSKLPDLMDPVPSLRRSHLRVV